MLVHRDSKNLVLNLKNPQAVLDAIPHAKTLPHNGATVVVVPHRDDEVRVLRNLGFDAPAPVDSYYDWPCHFPNGPMSHQRQTVQFLSVHDRAYVTSGMGSGKTLCALWAYDWRRQIGRATRMLVTAPLSTLTRVWYDEVFTHLPHLTCAVLHGSMDVRLKLLNHPHDVYVVNHDALRSKPLLDALNERDDIDVLTIDELAVFRSSDSERFKAMRRLVANRKTVWGFTGTPIPNAPTDAWAQCRIVTPHTVPKFFGQFRDATMRQFGPFKWVARDDALETVRKAMQPAIRFSREECIDLPPTTYSSRQVDLTPEQNKAFNDMVKTLMAEVSTEQITAVSEAAKLLKLLQICCGSAYVGESEVHLDASPRYSLVKEIVEEAEGKTIVFVPFTSALKRLVEYMRKHGFSTEAVYGDVGRSQRDEIFRAFQKNENPRVLVADARTMSHGLSLTAANTIVWFAPITSTETFMQANERIPRPGQKLCTNVVTIEGSSLERLMYERLLQRKHTNGVLLDLIKKGV